jgi:hypothetical protein
MSSYLQCSKPRRASAVFFPNAEVVVNWIYPAVPASAFLRTGPIADRVVQPWAHWQIDAMVHPSCRLDERPHHCCRCSMSACLAINRGYQRA